VINTGDRAGEGVVQVYLRDEASSVARPGKEMKGFARVSLAPGDKRHVAFTLTPAQLGLWNRDMRFVVEPGVVTALIGASSDDIRLEGRFDISP